MQAKAAAVLTLSSFPGYGFDMAAVSTVRIYDTLKSHFGEADAQQFIEYLEGLTREARGELVTKADLKADLALLRSDLEKQLAELRADLEKQMASLRTELKTEIAEVRVDLIKWMFIFWIGQVAAVFGLIKFLFPSL
jgi:ATP phosphoribosyltransferase regulatory subunit HisZ